MQLVERSSVVREAIEQGFDFNSAKNGEYINFFTHLMREGGKKAYGHPAYNKYVRSYIEQKFPDSGLTELEFLNDELLPHLRKLVKEAKSSGRTISDVADEYSQILKPKR